MTDRNVVDLPLPFGPTNPKHDPAGTTIDSPSSASVSPNHFVSPRMRRGERWAEPAPPDIGKLKHSSRPADVFDVRLFGVCDRGVRVFGPYVAPAPRAFPELAAERASGVRSARAAIG